MDKKIRKKFFQEINRKINRNAGFLSAVEQSLKNKGYKGIQQKDKDNQRKEKDTKDKDTKDKDAKKQKVDYTETLPVGHGAVAHIPSNPFDANGGVNILFQFRYLQSHPPGVGAGINTVVVYADVKPIYGTKSFIISAVNKIMNHLKKKNPNARLKNYGMSAFSGGYKVVEDTLNNLAQIEGTLGKKMDAIVLADAGHTPKRAAQKFEQFAAEAAKGDRKFIMHHTAIPGISYKDGKPKKFTSTTQFADNLINELGLERQREYDKEKFKNLEKLPVSVAKEGNFVIIQADDNPNRLYAPGKKTHKGELTSNEMHWLSARDNRQLLEDYLKDWNS